MQNMSHTIDSIFKYFLNGRRIMKSRVTNRLKVQQH